MVSDMSGVRTEGTGFATIAHLYAVRCGDSIWELCDLIAESCGILCGVWWWAWELSSDNYSLQHCADIETPHGLSSGVSIIQSFTYYCGVANTAPPSRRHQQLRSMGRSMFHCASELSARRPCCIRDQAFADLPRTQSAETNDEHSLQYYRAKSRYRSDIAYRSIVAQNHRPFAGTLTEKSNQDSAL
jgi:hypothetical protein